MCEFISWIKHKGKILYLNDAKLRSNKGKEIAKSFFHDDVNGHGAIMAYYGLGRFEGIHHELDDFNAPSRFPEPIREDLKKGNFTLFKPQTLTLLDGILNAAAREHFDNAERIILADYYSEKITLHQRLVSVRKLLWSLIGDPENRKKIWR